MQQRPTHTHQHKARTNKSNPARAQTSPTQQFDCGSHSPKSDLAAKNGRTRAISRAWLFFQSISHKQRSVRASQVRVRNPPSRRRVPFPTLQASKQAKQAGRTHSLSFPMGNEHSTAAHGGKCDGVPFVTWRPPNSAPSPRVTTTTTTSSGEHLSVSSDRSARSSNSGGAHQQHSPTSPAASASPTATTTPVAAQEQQQQTNTPTSNNNNNNFNSQNASCYHFAEPSSFKYDKVARVVTAPAVFTKPAKADSVIVNRSELLGAIAIVERGGRVHFPDIVRRVLAAGAVGIVFIERVDNKTEMQSLFDGFHSSGRQSVPVPIVLLSKFHADQLVADQPARITIEILLGEQAIRHMVPDDTYFAVATAARAGEVELLKHLLYSDTSGSVLEVRAAEHFSVVSGTERVS